MSFELHQDKHQHTGGLAATTLVPRTPVKMAGTSGLLWSPIATAADKPDGYTGAGTYTASEVVTVYFSQNVVKAIAGGSVGASADVMVSSFGRLGPSGILAASAHWIIGQTVTAAAAGEVVSLYINPRKA
jgi:hypothetical protein